MADGVRDYGEQIAREFSTLDVAHGGQQSLVMGKTGSGKTWLLQRFDFDAILRGETVVWRARDIDTWDVFVRQGRGVLWLPEDSMFAFSVLGTIKTRRKNPQVLEVEKLDVPVRRFRRIDDLIEHLDPDRVNVVLTDYENRIETLFWLSFLDGLTKRRDARWIRLTWDEVQDVLRAQQKARLWWVQEKFVRTFPDLRKMLVNLDMSTHVASEVDNRVPPFIRYKIYMRGSYAIRPSRLYAGTLMKLKQGEAWVEAEEFGHWVIDPPSPHLLEARLIQGRNLAVLNDRYLQELRRAADREQEDWLGDLFAEADRVALDAGRQGES
jgi:hypothetical protein